MEVLKTALATFWGGMILFVILIGPVWDGVAWLINWWSGS